MKKKKAKPKAKKRMYAPTDDCPYCGGEMKYHDGPVCDAFAPACPKCKSKCSVSWYSRRDLRTGKIFTGWMCGECGKQIGTNHEEDW